MIKHLNEPNGKSHEFRVNIGFDSQGDPLSRVVAVSIEPTLPDDIARVFQAEGLWRDEATWMGPVERFEAAMVRLPAKWGPLRVELQRVLGLSGQLLNQGAGAGLRENGPGDAWAGGPQRNKTVVMGVLNVTPDSFFDGGRYAGVEQALERAKQMVANGVDIIDVGGESTRPNAEPVSVEEELARVIPVIEALSREISIPISIDTYKADVAKAALNAGATIVNDISGLQFDPDMSSVVAEADAGVVVMHIKGTPRTMQQNPTYNDVVVEVRDFLARSCEKAIAAGVDAKKIWIDPGIGFGKTLVHNLTLLSQLRAFRTLGFPVLVGTSNKSMIGQVLDTEVDDRTEGTAATVALAIANGADGVRVHDVKAMRRVATMTDAIVRGWEE